MMLYGEILLWSLIGGRVEDYHPIVQGGLLRMFHVHAHFEPNYMKRWEESETSDFSWVPFEKMHSEGSKFCWLP